MGHFAGVIVGVFHGETIPTAIKIRWNIWVDGFLLEWQRGADGRWKGLVNYRHEAGRRVALKDRAELMPCAG